MMRLVTTIGAALCAALLAPTLHAEESKLSFGAFGPVTVYQPSGPPSSVAIFVSGDGGWNEGVVDMARNLAQLEALVIGIDLPKYSKGLHARSGPCAYAAADFESLSQYVQKRFGLPEYQRPVLVGYSSGATLVYALLAQAPEGTFAGAVSLGFCPDLTLGKPLCRDNALRTEPAAKGPGVLVLPQEALESPWRVLQGEIDEVCSPAATRAFVSGIPAAKLFLLPKVGHGYSVPKRWLPQFRDAYHEITGFGVAHAAPALAKVSKTASSGALVDSGSVDDLPLVEIEPQGEAKDALAVILTGDGGWAGLDREVATILGERGLTVIGWNSLRYYWTARTPDVAAADLARILAHYLAGRPSARVLLIGYSRGADVLPFLVPRLPEELRRRVGLVALVGPATSVSFEFHVSDWLGGAPGDSLPILPEAEKIRENKLLCLQGDDETDSLCPALPKGSAVVEVLRGGHHFGRDYEGVARRILDAAGI